MAPVLVVMTLLVLTGPGGQRIEVNPHSVVTLRAPRDDEHFALGVKCLIHTSDGKFIAVGETCDAISERLQEDD